MALRPGSRIGVYEVESLIGQGGMGEVYLARDTQLGRSVALKVLPEVFAADAERLARFRREAQVLASLKHPNLAVIHGYEEASGEDGTSVRALVLEYIDGQTLADQLASGPVPLDEALPIARQIGEALQVAHDQGVIHRDLKPSNIKITSDGTVRVLDFGLAKLAGPAEALSGGSSSVSLSPTITSPAATTLGVILGTAAYMSPEQAKGKAADKRSDVWAFGCVLFEMLTAKRPFEGDDISDTLASVLKGEPDWAALPAGLPRPVETLLRSCLMKDPRARLADIAGALFVLRHHQSLAVEPVRAEAPTPARRRPVWLLFSAAALGAAAIAAVGGWAGWTLRSEGSGEPVVTRFGVSLAEGEAFSYAARHVVAVSPDGRALVYAAGNRLNLRRIDQLDAAPVRGTESQDGRGARGAFFSPDGEWVGFWTTTQLKKISVSGGAAVVLATVGDGAATGSHWTTEKTILYASESGIWRVSEDGGVPERLVKADGRRLAHPQLLPGNRAILFSARPLNGPGWDQGEIVVRALDDGRERRIASGADARYLPTGHVVFVVKGVLTAIPFDLASLSPTGGPVALVEGVAESGNESGVAHFDVSATGTLVYATRIGASSLRSAVWVDRQGRETPLGVEPRPYTYLQLSPDYTRVAFDATVDANRDIFVWDIAQRAMRRLTTAPAVDRAPVFTRDGKRIIFASNRAGATSLFWQSGDGVGEAEQLTKVEEAVFPTSVAPDGTVVVRRSRGDTSAPDVYGLSPSPDRKLGRLIESPEFTEENAEVSHNGRWLAYQTNKSGLLQVMVRPYPALDTEAPVSTMGGTEPLWSSDDRELFYRSTDGAILRVQVSAGATWSASVPEQVLPGAGLVMGSLTSPFRTYDVSKDGRRFLVLKPVSSPTERAAAPSMIVVENWFEELKQRVPVK